MRFEATTIPWVLVHSAMREATETDAPSTVLDGGIAYPISIYPNVILDGGTPSSGSATIMDGGGP